MVGEFSLDDAAFAGAALLAVLAPFEVSSPLVRLPAQSISNLEAAVVVACVLGGATVLARHAWQPSSRPPLAAPWFLFVAACAIAALWSTVSRLNAFHMTGRLGAALAVYLLTVAAAATAPRGRAIAGFVVAGGAGVALLAILEYLNVGRVLQLLTAFRPGITTVGAQLRAGGPLQYPTIASMYLEVVFAMAVGLMVFAIDNGGHRRAALLAAVALVIAEAIALTFTRAGVITIGATLVIVAVTRIRRRGADAAVRTVAALGVAIVALFGASRSADSLWLRLTSEGQESWYRAEIDAPSQVAFAADDVAAVNIKVSNTGRLVWDSTSPPPFYVSYHWLSADGSRVVAFEGLRTAFGSPVRPGDLVPLEARVRAPQQPGTYRLVWDVVQEGRLWFSTEPGALPFASQAQVRGSAARHGLQTSPLPARTVRPGRLQLWRAALAIVRAHPLFGIGPDNFRLAYGAYAGIDTPDRRTHSNNMYLEVLSGTGLVGAAAFALLLWRIGRTVEVANPGAVCALAAIAIHGFVDSFLSFAPTYVLFGITLGLACGRSYATEIAADAYRV